MNKLQKTLEHIEHQQFSAVRNQYEKGFNVGVRMAVRLVKEVLANETGDSRATTKHK